VTPPQGHWRDVRKSELTTQLVDARGQPIKRPYRAECNFCPWVGPIRFDPIVAQADGAAHDGVCPGLHARGPTPRAG
jgi:hypothetical protein